MAKKEVKSVREIRVSTHLNQSDFWGRIKVTQSGGSRYETGRNMPKPVQTLVRMVYDSKLKDSVMELCDLRDVPYEAKQELLEFIKAHPTLKKL